MRNSSPLRLTTAIIVIAFGMVGNAAEKNRGLSQQEREELRARLQHFYRTPVDPRAMNETVPRFDLRRQSWRPAGRPNSLRDDSAFRRAECAFLNRHFPGLDCDGNASSTNQTIEANDKPEDLTKTWVAADKVTRGLDGFPREAQVTGSPWSDDYWRYQWGGASLRYSAGKQYKTYDEAIAAYQQPLAWQQLVEKFDVAKATAAIREWSPAEKYDLAVGEIDFTFTNQQKAYGKQFKDEHGRVPSWMGVCDGWAAAAIMVPRPEGTATVTGPRDLKVTLKPHDVRALTSMSWTNGTWTGNFVGGRCTHKTMTIYPNGRFAQQECFDTNPATFHLALGNLIGNQKQSFVMDRQIGQVWNQPIYSYSFTYFNPLDSDKQSEDWKKVVVDYDDAFKGADRFQEPLTRGVRKGGKWDDTKVKKIVGVVASVVYVAETSPPKTGDKPTADDYTRISYTYDLELSETDGKLVATGGEWHENDHPDFLWIPAKGSTIGAEWDTDVKYSATTPPSPALRDGARAASAGGYPLCAVMAELVKQSSGKPYRCGKQSR